MWVDIPFRGGRYLGQVLAWTETPHGKGSYIQPGGNLYEAWFKDGLQHGRGRYICSTGKVEEGEWVDGWKHGHFVETYIDGTKKEGQYVNGGRQGQWTITRLDGTKEVGQLKYDEDIDDYVKQGDWVETDADGYFTQVTHWNNGDLLVRHCFNKKGEPIWSRGTVTK